VLGRGILGKPRGQLYEIAHASNIKDDELRMGGPPVDNVSIDEEGSITLVRLISWCAVLGIGLSLICFRSISATIMIFFIGAISAVASLACVWWLGSSADAIMMSMPAMVYVLGLSGAATSSIIITTPLTSTATSALPNKPSAAAGSPPSCAKLPRRSACSRW
jgi:hypothetical protein